eukprot:3935564-Rhodomonas_salina.1
MAGGDRGGGCARTASRGAHLEELEGVGAEEQRHPAVIAAVLVGFLVAGRGLAHLVARLAAQRAQRHLALARALRHHLRRGQRVRLGRGRCGRLRQGCVRGRGGERSLAAAVSAPRSAPKARKACGQ